MIGKAEYMPLEQAIGGKPAPAWDLFSAGVVLYELLTLRRPYPKVTADQFPSIPLWLLWLRLPLQLVLLWLIWWASRWRKGSRHYY